MFNFFAKKEYLVDHLDGFIDIHNHILPGIDDGAKTTDDSLALIKGMGEFGVNRFICTPHIMNNVYPNTPLTIKAAHSKLVAALEKEGMENVEIEIAAEHMIDDNFESIVMADKVMPIQENYLLIEMSYLQPPIYFDDVIPKIADKQLYPILAHPERYMFLHKNKSAFSGLKDKGLLFQLNLLSLGEHYGPEVKKIAWFLLEEGLINFAASDIHRIKQIESLKKIEIPVKKLRLVTDVIERTKSNF